MSTDYRAQESAEGMEVGMETRNLQWKDLYEGLV